MKFFRISVYILLAVASLANAQEMQNPPAEYRIIAVKAGNTEITSVSNEIKLYLPMSIYLPTAFTPNGDGLNDDFGAVGEGIEAYQLIIYNRWGQIIFESKNINEKWDGNYNGKQAPPGVYSYELLAYGKEFGEVFKSGNVLKIN